MMLNLSTAAALNSLFDADEVILDKWKSISSYEFIGDFVSKALIQCYSGANLNRCTFQKIMIQESE